jgi:hypothetical protein
MFSFVLLDESVTPSCIIAARDPIGITMLYQGWSSSQPGVKRLAIADVEGKRDIEDRQDQQDANREARKRHVVERAIQVVSEIVAELEREENAGGEHGCRDAKDDHVVHERDRDRGRTDTSGFGFLITRQVCTTAASPPGGRSPAVVVPPAATAVSL